MKKQIPKRSRIPVLTDISEYRKIKKDALGYFKELVTKYGNVCYVPTYGNRSYYIHEPAVIREMLVTQSASFRKSEYYRVMKNLVGEGLFASDGELHRRQRKLMAPAFHKERIAGYADIMVQCTLDEMATWKDVKKVNISQAMVNITLQVVTRSLFDSVLSAGEMSRASELVKQILETSGKIFENPLQVYFLEHHFLSGPVKKFNRLKKELDETVLAIISRYRSQSATQGKDLLSMLLFARDEENGTGMSDEQIRDEVITMFLAGHETTATALNWAWYLLGKHPGICDQFYTEVESVIGDRIPCAEDYSFLPFTKDIFRETLRLFPPAWMIAREAIEDVEMQGYRFPKGSVLLTVIYLAHRNAEYFADPDQFSPERWRDRLMEKLPKFAFFPFGGGQRMCIGEGFAWMEAVLVMATIAANYKLTLPSGFTTEPSPGFTLRTSKPVILNIDKT